ncbi:MAG: phosphate ABC transporter substrate-binding protein [Deltaproteobacteria bacterium]|nr:phosphate ABC transporter substrate-binding protein [Deltaproteobacteria bacterium]
MSDANRFPKLRRCRVIPGALFVTAAVLLACGLNGCGKGGEKKAGGASSSGTTTVQVKGSDTMVNLAQAWAEEYKKVEPAIDVEVSGGGSGVGIAALTKGAVDIANASRNMKLQEIEDAKKNTGKEPKEFVVGHDALAIFVHKDNPMSTITLEQIAQIYEEGGKITKWSELGVKLPSGQDEIIRVSRQSSSGTYEFLREHVLKNKDFKLGSRDLNGSKEVVELVSNTPGAIGYSGMGYATPSVKMLKVSEKAGAPAVPPSVEATQNRTYPIARSLLLYTLGEPQGAVKKYIDWILTDAGQKIVEQTGYVPVFASERAK